MEEWQNIHITKNLPNLISNIKCNAVLLSHLSAAGVLATEDVELLQARGNQFGDQDRSNHLLDLLLTRKQAYKHLGRALSECNQSGAFDILLKGMQTHVVSQDVIFQGVCIPLERLCSPIGVECLQSLIKDTLDSTNYEQFLNEDPVTVSVNTVPDPLKYYVPRTLSISTQLEPKIFKELEKDIFCVEGMELYQLSSLSSKIVNSTSDRSRNQIHEVTAKFILLEHHEDFQEIVNKTDKTVHWIKHNSNEFFYVKCSAGTGIQAIQPFLKSNSPQHLSEDEFLERCQNVPGNAPILLYDSPGMGKSVLMANLGRKTKANQPSSTVVFYEISRLISKVGHVGQGYTSAAIKEALTGSITTDRFGANILNTLLNTADHQVELFLDAFDEVSGDDLESAHKILDCIAKECKNIRMFLSSRAHRRDELESKFGVLGFNILPFDNSNKLFFFQNYWKNEHSIKITEGVKEFADHCLKTVNLNMSSEDGDIAGIPLQCRMLADIYAENAKKGGFIPSESQHQLSSIFKVYKLFIDTKFEAFCSNADRDSYYDFHVRESLRLLFPRIYNALPDDRPVPDYQLIYRIGLLEPSKSDSRHLTFLHRTLAECFAAEFLATSVTSKFPREAFRIPLTLNFIQHAMLTSYIQYPGRVELNFQHPVICRFLDFFLSSMHSPGQDMTGFKNALRVSNYYTSDRLLELLECSLMINAIHLWWCLLELYLDLDESSEKSISVLKFKHSLRDTQNWTVREARKLELLNDLKNEPNFETFHVTAIRHSSLNLVKLAFAFLESVTGKTFLQVQYDKKKIPMYFALRRSHHQIFEYLLSFDRDGFYEQPLLHWCLEESYGKDVGDKVQIVKGILEERPDLLNKPHPDHYNEVPLLAGKAHFELIQILIEAGADLTQTNVIKRNIAHKAAEYFSADEYHWLVELIISRNAQGLFKRRDKWGLTPVHWALMRIDLKGETLEFLANTCNVNFNDNFPEYWGSELEIARWEGRSERVIADIIRLRGDNEKLNKKEKQSCSTL